MTKQTKTRNNMYHDDMCTQKRNKGRKYARVGADVCVGARRHRGTQKRGKKRHRWSCRGMNDGQWLGKFPQNAGTAGDGMRETRMGADGHGWVCEGANECIGARGHEKKTRTVTNGRGWAETDTLRTRENRARNRYTYSAGTKVNGRESGELRVMEMKPWCQDEARNARAQK